MALKLNEFIFMKTCCIVLILSQISEKWNCDWNCDLMFCARLNCQEFGFLGRITPVLVCLLYREPGCILDFVYINWASDILGRSSFEIGQDV